MKQASQLSQREKEVVNLLMQGKTNKEIAFSLGISIRTVEFHLKNVYTKLHVSSRIELILKQGNATGNAITEKLGYSTVVKLGESTHNIDKNPQLNWAAFFPKTASKNSTSSKTKSLLNPKHVLIATVTVLSSGFFWGVVFAIFIGKAVP
jgi:DNA-binding CsgD family transcriptional regulator